MTELEWVEVDHVGGKKAWGDVSRLVLGRERERKVTNQAGEEHTIIEKVIKIERLDDGTHLVFTSAPLPIPEGEEVEG